MTGPLHGLILGGQKSGKSRLAEQRAAAWLAVPGRRATLVATALAGDAEMARRIARHQADRAARVPGLATLEEPVDLAGAIRRHSAPGHLLVVDCLTLWLTQRLMPLQGVGLDDKDLAAATTALLAALQQAPGPVLWVSNEIGLGISPLGAEVRRFLDALGLLHQQIAGLCGQVQLVVAGCPLTVKGSP
ncbi:MAG: bifunctional adenosylcobinamide kinase/adenosylcobinamide-phosphate guanylyltransferase [Pseudomonadota bacterium]